MPSVLDLIHVNRQRRCSLDTHRIRQGYTAVFTVTIRDEDGVALADYYDGSETMDLVIADSTGTEITLTASTVAWATAVDATFTLTVHEDDTDLMDVGVHRVTVGVTKSSNRVEVYTATLRIEPKAA